MNPIIIELQRDFDEAVKNKSKDQAYYIHDKVQTIMAYEAFKPIKDLVTVGELVIIEREMLDAMCDAGFCSQIKITL